MTTRSSSTVTFTRPFTLPGMEGPHPAGSFEIFVDREQLDVSWEAYHTTTTIMLVRGAFVQALPVKAADLEAALAADKIAGAPVSTDQLPVR